MHIQTHAVRSERKHFDHATRNGHYPLVVVGNQKAGYRLGANVNDNRIVLFGKSYRRQRSALGRALEVYGQKPARITLDKAA
jgi:hypothetical protein